jgi:hypothetical protein
MRTNRDLINRTESVKVSRKALGAALDAAERALHAAEAGGDRHHKHEFVAADGALQHTSASCPWCDLRRTHSAYLAAARAPVLKRSEALEGWSLPAGESPARRMSRVAHCRKVQRAAHLAYAAAATDRKRCDAAAQMERAESDFAIVLGKTLRTFSPDLVLQELNAARERKRVAGDALKTAYSVGRPEEVIAAELTLDAANSEADLVRSVRRHFLERMMTLVPAGSRAHAALAAQLGDLGDSIDSAGTEGACHA